MCWYSMRWALQFARRVIRNLVLPATEKKVGALAQSRGTQQ